MRKKIIISSIVVVVLILGIIGFYIWDNRVISTITLDINPSVEINLKRGNKVKSIKALNSDAKDIISNVKGKKLDKALETLTDNVIEKGYANEGEVVILISSDGNVKNKTIEETLKSSFDKKHIPVEVITIKNITKEDEELAKKYNITPAKASYIKSVVKENENLEIKDLVDKSVKELNQTKESGFYCDPGYNLDGDKCYKEVERISASNGEVCPPEYNEYNGTCYHETGTIEGKNYTCPEGRTLKDNKCVMEWENDATPSKYECASGELKKMSDVGIPSNGGPDDYICYDATNASKPILRCLTINHIMINGRCADGPKPMIGNGCEAGDPLVNGGCYTYDNGDQYVCPDGRIYQISKGGVPEYCPDTVKTSKPTITEYKCDDKKAVIEGNKCVVREEEDAFKERICRDNYQLIEGRCLNLNMTKEKQTGLVCDGDNTRLIDNKCVIYDIIEAKRN